MSAEQQGPAGGSKGGARKPAAKPPRVGASLTDAVVAALAKVDDKGDGAGAQPPPVGAEAGCAATMTKDGAPAFVTAGPSNGANGFRSGPGSFSDLARRFAGGAALPVAAPVAPPQAPPAVAAPAAPPPVAAAPAPAAPPPPAAVPPSAAVPPPPVVAAAPVAVEIPRSSQPVVTPAVGPVQTVPAPEPGKSVQVRYFGRTDVGLVREHNEDNFLVADLTGGERGSATPKDITVGERGAILAVCDGMGGAAAGEVASQMAVDTIYEVFSREALPKGDRDAFARRLVRSIEEAGHRIFSAAKMDRTRRGMGTTTTLAGLVDNVLFVGQVGDSRAYVLRNGALEQITKDQSLVNQLIEAGQLTEEEAEAFEHSNIILQALGTTEEVTVDLTFLELRRGDRLIMCSDGLSGLVHADMIRDALVESKDISDAAAKLIQMANAGGGHDNITVILADFDGEGLAPAESTKVHYQQYPLPPDESGRVSGSPRETSMKSGGPKPGADVKRDGGVGASHELAEPQGGSKAWIGIVALLLVVAVVAGVFVFKDSIFGGGEETDPEPAQTRPDPEPVLPPDPDPVVEPPDVVENVEPVVAAQGTVRVSTDVPNGTLYVNGQAHGPLTDGMTLELAPGAYSLEARSGDTRIVTQTVTVNEGQEAAVALRVPAGAVEAPRPPRPQTPRPQTPRPERPEIRPTPFGGGGGSPTPTVTPRPPPPSNPAVPQNPF